MAKMLKQRIFDRIRYKGKNWVFSATDFIKKFKRWEIDQTLAALEKDGKIERILPGLYYYPEFSEFLQETVAADLQQVADALARKYS